MSIGQRTNCGLPSPPRSGNLTGGRGAPGIPGGRDVAQEIIETSYANQRTGQKFKGCASYADFRELFQTEKDVNAVKIMTPDHLHATIAIAAMKRASTSLCIADRQPAS